MDWCKEVNGIDEVFGDSVLSHDTVIKPLRLMASQSCKFELTMAFTIYQLREQQA